jgi:cyclomaltodextrinase
MCFRTFMIALAAFLTGPRTGGVMPPDGAGREALFALVARDPGVLEVRVPVSEGVDAAGMWVRVVGAAEAGIGAARDGTGWGAFRVTGAEPGVAVARIVVPGGLEHGRTVRLEIGGGADGASVTETVFFTPGPITTAEVPDWSKGMVWYQVFPERFRNGNPGNDPRAWDATTVAWDQPLDAVTIEEIELLWNRRVVAPRFFSNDPGRWWGAAGQVIFEKRYGGDLQGVVEKLDELAALGVTGLYLCPVFEARSLHKYEASDHRHVDPTLGHPGVPESADRSGEDPLDETTWGWEPADRYLIEVLLPEARKRGLRVILDGVWNHVGTDHFAFRDVLEKGRESAYAGWFKAEFDEGGRVVSYEAWDRPNGGLPEFRQTPQGDLAPGPKAHIAAVTRRWMDPNADGDPSDGIDGWRLDVAPEIGRAFWNDWRGLVRSINPEALLVGEIWTDAELWFNGVAFDAQMNYPLAYPIVDWLALAREGTDAAGFAARVHAALNHHPMHDLAQMTLIASHDTERGASLMRNDFARQFDNGAAPWSARYDREPVGDGAKRRLLAAFALLAVLPGSPMVYNGDEFAMAGADDPDNRRPVPWADLGGGPGGLDAGFRDRLGAMLAWRNDPAVGDVLRFGAVEVVPGVGDGVVVRRWLDGVMVEAAVARTGEPTFERTPLNWGISRDLGVEGPVRVRVLGWEGVR